MSLIEKKMDLRKFGFLIGTALAFMAAWSFFRYDFPIIYFMMPAVLVFTVAVLNPSLLVPLYKVWIAFGRVISGINSTVVLTAVYFMVVVPTKFLKKLLGKSSQQFSFRYEKVSYWIPRKSSNSSENMKRLF